MIVKFYKTKLSAQNRCYDRAAYDRYLASCVKETVDIPADIIPNTTFYVPPYIRNGTTVTGAIQWQKYNYIEYVYAGMKYGSFITSIQPLAANSTVAISHSTDNWYYLLQNFTDSNGNPEFDMHGQVNRAHVNDFEKVASGYKPTLKNTFISPESSCSSNGVSVGYYDLTTLIDNQAYIYGLHYIYCLINNPNQSGFSYGEQGSTKNKYEDNAHQYFETTIGRKTRSINMLMCGCINDDGLICWAVFDTIHPEAITEDWKTYLINMQSEAITKVLISDIPPNKYCSLQRDEKGVGYIYYNKPEGETIGLGHCDNLQGLPTNFSIINLFDPKPVKINLQPSITITDLKIYDGSTDVDPLILNTYESYKKYGLVKLHSSPYNSFSYCSKTIDYSKANLEETPTSVSTLSIEIGMDYSLQFYYASFKDLVTIDKESSYTVINCTNAFDPLVRKSYFDQYDLTIATSNATIKKFDLGFGLFKSLLGVGTGVVRAATSKNPVDGISQAVGSGVDFTHGLSTLGYKVKSINAEKDKAIGQITNGEISSDTAMGFYAYAGKLDIVTAYLSYLNDDGYEQLAPIIHRYGYNTPLQFDEVYKNHKRQYFNYIECSTCDIDGVPLDIAGDVETMFESGVHLWNDTVGDWEVPNWQVEVYEWIKGGKK